MDNFEDEYTSVCVEIEDISRPDDLREVITDVLNDLLEREDLMEFLQNELEGGRR